MALVDWQIRNLCKGDNPMITPFRESFKHVYGTSVGLSIAGYDCSLGKTIKIFDKNSLYTHKQNDDVWTEAIDPHNAQYIAWDTYELYDDIPFTVYPNTFMLAETEEVFDMPINVNGFVINKSTNARNGIEHLSTNLENGWRGRLTLELHFRNEIPVRIMKGMGIIHIAFFETAVPEFHYGTRSIGGKYQNAEGLQTAKAG